jgi:hypothetical protein
VIQIEWHDPAIPKDNLYIHASVSIDAFDQHLGIFKFFVFRIFAGASEQCILAHHAVWVDTVPRLLTSTRLDHDVGVFAASIKDRPDKPPYQELEEAWELIRAAHRLAGVDY